MRLVRAHEEALPRLELQVVEQQRHHRARVPGELRVQPEHELAELGLLLRSLRRRFGLVLRCQARHKRLELIGLQLIAGGYEGREERLKRGALRRLVGADGGLDASGGLDAAERAELGVLLQVRGDLGEAAEVAHALEGRERDAELGLVVRVLVDVRPLGVQLLRERLVRVRLHAQRLVDAQHLEEERQAAVLLECVAAEDGGVRREPLRQGLVSGVAHGRRRLRVGAHPELRIGLALLELEAGVARHLVGRDAGLGARLAPGILLDAAT
mmetsp:Transcript_1553/g.4247  ORF Transcript_1553/g.4247 Transcript_1553/m.4247 type:complete len:270 (-) Transcript_1553:198-1007(-)